VRNPVTESRLLKKDLFGEVSRTTRGADACIVRDAGAADAWLRWLARLLLRREARALAALDGIEGVPQLVEVSRDRLVRSYLGGAPMHEAQPGDPAYFLRAARLLRRLHSAGVVHNDLAKEPNILVSDDGTPAFIDFQLAWYTRNRGRLFRILAHEDLRHLLKHKRNYCADRLTERERRILANPSPISNIYMNTVKPVYRFVTRRLLGWADREGAGNRGDR
jgi:RIO-like serine/threonine protein kinase